MTEWKIIGLNEYEACVTINSIDYVIKKENTALVHAILCLADEINGVKDQLENVSYKVGCLGKF